MVGLGLGLCLQLRPTLELRSPYESAVKLYCSSNKIPVEVALGPRKITVPMAMIKCSELETIIRGERSAGTTGGMFFITRKTPKKYRPFTAFHELAEHAARAGFDITGMAKHFQALAVELGYARVMLSNEEYEHFFKWRKSGERSNFFDLGFEDTVNQISFDIERVFRSIPPYLTYEGRPVAQLTEQ